MKHLLLAAAAVLAFGSAAMAQDLRGDWRTAPDDNGNTGIIRVSVCGDAYCGTLVQAFDPSGATMQSPNVGRQIIWDTRPTGGGEFRGRLWAPDRDREYASRLQLDGNTLVVSGCILGGAACREGGRWQRLQ